METINELYLKTAFCCIACDGEIATEELSLVKNLASESDLFENIEVEVLLNQYLEELKTKGNAFISCYLQSIANAQLAKDEELKVCYIAIKTILVDKCIEYKEIAFFKRIRAKLEMSDEDILSATNIQNEFTATDSFVLQGLTLQSFLQPDIIDDNIFDWNINLDKIELQTIESNLSHT